MHGIPSNQTYAGEVTIRPGPRLNLILGPNGGILKHDYHGLLSEPALFQPPGTGKSSLVCAICIGLGGSTKVRFFREQHTITGATPEAPMDYLLAPLFPIMMFDIQPTALSPSHCSFWAAPIT